MAPANYEYFHYSSVFPYRVERIRVHIMANLYECVSSFDQRYPVAEGRCRCRRFRSAALHVQPACGLLRRLRAQHLRCGCLRRSGHGCDHQRAASLSQRCRNCQTRCRVPSVTISTQLAHIGNAQTKAGNAGVAIVCLPSSRALRRPCCCRDKLNQVQPHSIEQRSAQGF